MIAPHWLRPPVTPPMILIGGVTGSGKGYLSAQLARRLGQPRVISTDAVRAVLRGVLDDPCLHTSSFLAETAWPHSQRRRRRIIEGFEAQARLLIPSLKHIIERHRQEGEGLILEGVHLTPDILAELANRDTAVLVTAVRSPAEHRRRFHRRAAQTARAAERYLAHFGVIRLLQEHLLLRAAHHELPVLWTDAPGSLHQAMDCCKQPIATL